MVWSRRGISPMPAGGIRSMLEVVKERVDGTVYGGLHPGSTHLCDRHRSDDLRRRARPRAPPHPPTRRPTLAASELVPATEAPGGRLRCSGPGREARKVE